MAMAPPPQDERRKMIFVGGEAVFGQLEVVRAEAQDWIRSIVAIEGSDSMAEPAARLAETTEAFQREIRVVNDNVGHIGRIVDYLQNVLANDPAVASQMGDAVTHVTNAFTRALFEWSSLLDEAKAGRTLSPGLKRIKKDLSDAVWQCGFLTIPNRVNQHLRVLRIGQGLDFHAVFADELPEKGDRDKLLKYIYDHPASVSGVIDVSGGKIFRASRNRWRRLASLAFIALTVAVDYVILWLLATRVTELAVPAAGLAEQRWSILWKLLTALLAGSFTHIAIGALKQARNRQGEAGFIAVDDFVVWAHVREVQLVLGVLAFLIGVIGLLLVFKRTDIVTAFFVGYSFDSFLDLFLQRFDKTSATQITSISKAAGAV
jgi:hypothetical protein